MSFGRSIGCVVGMAAAGPVGSLVGSLTGGLMEIAIGSTLTSLVGQEASSLISTKVGEILTTATTEQVQKASRFLFKLDTEERHRLNSDLQQAFRDALCEAIYDIGGPKSFPRIWKPTKRDVPDEVIYAAAQRTDGIAVQAQACLGKFEQAVREERILSLDSLTAQGAPHIATYPQVSTPKDLLDTFFADVVDPLLSNDLDLCLVCSSELKLHLRSYLLDRTLLHLGELLKQPERTQAWRTFNRLLIEGMREDIAKIETGQLEIMQRLDTLLSRPEAAFADNMADLLTATGKLDKQLDENFDTLFERIAAQHLELLESFDQLTDVARRTESKIDRVLRILENGQYVIQGAPPISPDEPPFPGEPPFKGLQCFDIADTECFFGREVLTARLVTRISEQLSRQECRFLAVVGSSGSGKSSVVRAGLLPALQRGQPLVDGKLPPEGSEHWAVHVLTPTSHPLDALAISLTRRSGSLAAAETLAQDLAQSTRSLHLAACRIVDRSSSVGQLLLVVDQFEELFTTCKNEDERKAFIANLLYAVRQAGPTLVVITLRADFYAACACYDELREVVAQQQEFIGLMNAQELRRAIEGPAEYSNWQFEPGLVELILHDVGDEPGALPQFRG